MEDAKNGKVKRVDVQGRNIQVTPADGQDTSSVKEEVEELDEVLTGERYKKVIKKPGGTSYSRKVSADPAKRATRGGRGGESDFGAGDRGSGNKAARRAGTYREYQNEEVEQVEEEQKEFPKGKVKASIAKKLKSDNLDLHGRAG